MKRHSMFVAPTLAGALAIATPAIAGGLLGGITGGAGAGVLGTAGGALFNPVSNFGAAGVLGATSQFQGQVMQPITIQRPALPAVSPNLGIGAGGALDATGQVQGEVARPDLTLPRPLLPKATGAAGSVVTHTAVGATGETGGAISAASRNAQAAGEIGSSISTQNRSAQATGGAFAGGSTAAGPASFGAEGATQAQARAGY